MASLDHLVSLIYHERQQAGSMLCAQHALNGLLQGNYFTAPDLSEIARFFDNLEQHYDDANSGRTSTNMDDTGFFSVQVLDQALKVWGLNLIRWRSESMRPYHDHPHTQLAFVLNYEHHWYTLRRFGPALSDHTVDPGNGHWFNLNSVLKSPEWVSKLYLGMVLQQAESDGYSVFAVTQADPLSSLALPRTAADEIASMLPEPSSTTTINTDFSTKPSTLSSTSASDTQPVSQSQPHPALEETFDDEDFELQAVLHASLAGGATTPHIPGSWLSEPSHGASSSSIPASGEMPPSHGYGAPGRPSNHIRSTHHGKEVDPVAESMARNLTIMERMRREQEMAQQELYENGVLPFRRRKTVGEQEEEDMLRRAIAESKAFSQDEEHEQADDDQDEAEDVEVDGPELTSLYPTRRSYEDVRVYDDDDEGLQQALKASLEAVPNGFPIDLPISTPAGVPPAEAETMVSGTDHETERMDASSEAEASVTSATSDEHEIEPVNVDELRKRRLARFGG